METALSSPAIVRSSFVGGYEGRVCLICYRGSYKYDLVILDFDVSAIAPAIMKKSPTLQFNHGRHMIFCVSDRYLYVIFSECAEFLSRTTHPSMSKYDLLPHLLSSSNVPSKVSESDLVNCQVPKMNSSKRKAGVAASPDGRKVVVYSTIIEYHITDDLDFEGNDTDFEVFDTMTGEWSILPQLNLWIPHNMWSPRLFYQQDTKSVGGWISCEGGHLFMKSGLNRDTNIFVSAGNFINGNTFLVTLRVGLMFALILDSPEEGWKQYGDEHVEPKCHEFLVFESLVLTPGLVRTIRGNEVVKQFNLSSLNRPNCLFTRLSVLKYVENQECFMCTVRGWIDDITSLPILILDVVKLDLVPGNGNGSDSQPSHIGSYRYTLDLVCSYIYAVVVSPMAIESEKERKRTRFSLQ